MDPWLKTDTPTNVENNENSLHSNTFEDNFDKKMDRLPDSEDYLQTLESKLAKIRRDPNILKQLAEKREACMRQLLSDSTNLAYNQLDEPVITNSYMFRTIFPEKVALNQGEVAELVKNDQFSEEDSSEAK